MSLKGNKQVPLVSVVIPAYNCTATLEEAVASIINQTFRDIEIVIVDDGSMDGTLELARDIAREDDRIRVFTQGSNKGVGAARERGIYESRGKFICWQDADDISIADRVEVQAKFLDGHPGVGVVGGFLQFFDEKGDGIIRRYAEFDPELRSNIFRYNPVAQPASMFRRECFNAVGYYDDSLVVAEDLDMLFRVGEKYEFGNVQQVVIRYRQSSTSLTASKLKDMEKTALSLRKKYKNSPRYSWTIADSVFNFLQRATMFIPPSLRIKLFKMIRGDK